MQKLGYLNFSSEFLHTNAFKNKLDGEICQHMEIVHSLECELVCAKKSNLSTPKAQIKKCLIWAKSLSSYFSWNSLHLWVSIFPSLLAFAYQYRERLHAQRSEWIQALSSQCILFEFDRVLLISAGLACVLCLSHSHFVNYIQINFFSLEFRLLDGYVPSDIYATYNSSNGSARFDRYLRGPCLLLWKSR